MTQAIVIPPEGPFREIQLKRSDRRRGHLDHLQRLVGGNIEALDGLANVLAGEQNVTAYVNEDGKGVEPLNMRATDYMVPGVGIFWGDYIVGSMVIVGFSPSTGEHTDTVPDSAVRRAKLIADESGAGWQPLTTTIGTETS